MQSDGNLVLHHGATVVWSSGTSSAGAHALLQGDGNLVVYSSTSQPLWASEHRRQPGCVSRGHRRRQGCPPLGGWRRAVVRRLRQSWLPAAVAVTVSAVGAVTATAGYGPTVPPGAPIPGGFSTVIASKTFAVGGGTLRATAGTSHFVLHVPRGALARRIQLTLTRPRLGSLKSRVPHGTVPVIGVAVLATYPNGHFVSGTFGSNRVRLDDRRSTDHEAFDLARVERGDAPIRALPGDDHRRARCVRRESDPRVRHRLRPQLAHPREPDHAASDRVRARSVHGESDEHPA